MNLSLVIRKNLRVSRMLVGAVVCGFVFFCGDISLIAAEIVGLFSLGLVGKE